MLRWELYFQNKYLLNAYRMVSLDRRNTRHICDLIGVSDGKRVLDVGCGTGAFTYYLADYTSNCEYTGIDISDIFIEDAISKLHNDKKNKMKFIMGDALNLPFPDDYFDVVTSYTFLTNVHNSDAAIKEMKRVTKVGGYISSITAQSHDSYTEFEGRYPMRYTYRYEYLALRAEIEAAYQKVQPVSEYTRYGIKPQKIPLLFNDCRIEDISIHPIGWAFSLSDCSLSADYKVKYINYETDGQIKKLEEYSKLTQFRELISLEQITRFQELLEQRRAILIENISENDCWEWFGGSQLLVCGRKS